MRDAECITRRRHEIVLQSFRWSVGDAVYENIEFAVAGLQFLEHLLDVAVIGHVALKRLGAGKGYDEILGFESHALVLVHDGQLRTGFLQTLRNAPRNAALVRDAKNGSNFSFEINGHSFSPLMNPEYHVARWILAP